MLIPSNGAKNVVMLFDQRQGTVGNIAIATASTGTTPGSLQDDRRNGIGNEKATCANLQSPNFGLILGERADMAA